MFGMGFVCLCVSRPYVWHGVCLFVCQSSLCLAWGLSVCVSLVLMFGMGFVCLCLCLTYVCRGQGHLLQTKLINCFWNIW